MKRKEAEGSGATRRTSSAANEEFTTTDGGDSPERAQSGWNPYEVWRTRVKDSASETPEHEPDPFH